MADPDYLSKVTKRKRFHYAKYVNYDKERNISECLVCRKQLKSLSTGNIKRHYLKLHDRNLDTDADSRIRSFSLRKFCKFKPSMGMNKSEFLTCCVGLVAIRNIPISLFDDEDYFKKLFAPFEEEFKMTLSSKKIKGYLSGTGNKLRSIISDEIRAKLVCLKFEVVTWGRERGFLVMNIQYIDDFKILVQTVGVIEMVKNQDIDMQLIWRILNECGLDDSLVYSSSSNTSSNIYVPELNGFSNAKHDTDWMNEYEKMHSNITDVARCPSQTLHSVAKNVIAELHSEIENCRRNVLILQSISQDKCEMQMPVLDISTRWLSTFSMIESLSKMRAFVESLPQTSPLHINWTFVIKFVAAFKPLKECLDKLREVNYIVGDFYRDCLCCEIELEELAGGNMYANVLLKELKVVKAKLLENGAFLAALYMDQRFNFIKTPFLTEEQQHYALEHLLTTVMNLKRPTIKDEYSSDEGERSIDTTTDNDPFVKLEEKTKSLIGSLTPSKGKTIKEKLECLRFDDRLSFHVDILNHWKCLTYEDFEMKQLVEAVLALPCTQSSIEMTMKELANVLQNSDSSVLPNKTLACILMTRLNGNILNFINLDVKNDDIG